MSKNSILQIFSLSILISLTTHSYAEERKDWKWGPELGLGLSMLNGDEQAIDRDKSGYHLLFSLDLLKYTPNWVFEGSLGGVYNHFQTDDGLATLKTFPFKVEFGARYRLGNGWQLGPSIPFLFFTDVSFSENPELFTERQKQFAAFIGARLDKEVSVGNTDWRFGLHGYTDLNISFRQVFWFGLHAALEFPFTKSPERPAREEVVQLEATPEQPLQDIVTPKPIASVTPSKDILLNLDSSILRFKVNLAQLDNDQKELVKALGIFLAKNPAYYRSIRVHGHADVTGNQLQNQKLSEARAMHILDVLSGMGIDRGKFEYQGFGSSRPINSENTPSAYAQNRRVEIYLDGTKRPEQFVNAINQYVEKTMRQMGMERKTYSDVGGENQSGPVTKPAQDFKPIPESRMNLEESKEDVPAGETSTGDEATLEMPSELPAD